MAKKKTIVDDAEAVTEIVDILNGIEDDEAMLNVVKAVAQLFGTFWIEAP